MKFQENPPMDAETQPKMFLFKTSDHHWPTANELTSITLLEHAEKCEAGSFRKFGIMEPEIQKKR